MDRTEIKLGKQQQLLRLSSENLFTITSAAKTANSIKTFRCFGMTWRIQVEVTLAPIQGRWCYDRFFEASSSLRVGIERNQVTNQCLFLDLSYSSAHVQFDLIRATDLK